MVVRIHVGRSAGTLGDVWFEQKLPGVRRAIASRVDEKGSVRVLGVIVRGLAWEPRVLSKEIRGQFLLTNSCFFN